MVPGVVASVPRGYSSGSWAWYGPGRLWRRESGEIHGKSWGNLWEKLGNHEKSMGKAGEMMEIPLKHWKSMGDGKMKGF